MGLGDFFKSALAVAGGGPAVIGTLGSMAGGIMQNQSSARQAAKQRDFERDMSDTAHQREAIDLEKAGLNRILSGTGGSGASTPAGASATQSDVVTPAINSAVSIIRTLADTANTNADTLNKNLQPGLTEALTDKAYEESWQANTAQHLNRQKAQESMAQEDLLDAQRERIPYEERLLDAQRSKASMESLLTHQTRLSEQQRTAILSENKEEAKATALKAFTDQQINGSWYGKILRFIERTADAVAVPISAIRGGRKSGGITINNK